MLNTKNLQIQDDIKKIIQASWEPPTLRPRRLHTPPHTYTNTLIRTHTSLHTRQPLPHDCTPHTHAQPHTPHMRTHITAHPAHARAHVVMRQAPHPLALPPTQKGTLYVPVAQSHTQGTSSPETPTAQPKLCLYVFPPHSPRSHRPARMRAHAAPHRLSRAAGPLVLCKPGPLTPSPASAFPSQRGPRGPSGVGDTPPAPSLALPGHWLSLWLLTTTNNSGFVPPDTETPNWVLRSWFPRSCGRDPWSVNNGLNSICACV